MKAEFKGIKIDTDVARDVAAGKIKAMRAAALSKMADVGTKLAERQIELISKLRERAAQ